MKNITLFLHETYFIEGFITINKNDKLRYMGERGGIYAFVTDNGFEYLFSIEQLNTAKIIPTNIQTYNAKNFIITAISQGLNFYSGILNSYCCWSTNHLREFEFRQIYQRMKLNELKALN